MAERARKQNNINTTRKSAQAQLLLMSVFRQIMRIPAGGRSAGIGILLPPELPVIRARAFLEQQGCCHVGIRLGAMVYNTLNGMGTRVRVLTFFPSFSPGVKTHLRTASMA